MPSFVDGPQLLDRLRAEYLRTRRADLAVAFWGTGARENLGFIEGEGVRIVCNLRSGGTNPHEIRALRRMGADVRQLNDLHAKIGVVGDMSFVGSSNMSANGLGAEGAVAVWREANVVYGNARPEIEGMFNTFWHAATEINETDLEAAEAAWARRQHGNAAVFARQSGRSLVDVLRTSPKILDDLNVRMVVYDTPTDADEQAVLEAAEGESRARYGQFFTVYWGWPSMTNNAATAYLVNYEWPARGRIARGTLYRRDMDAFPDFEHGGEIYHAAYEIEDIEGITFGEDDKRAICQAFHDYVRDGHRGEAEDERSYNFPISDLRPFLPGGE